MQKRLIFIILYIIPALLFAEPLPLAKTSLKGIVTDKLTGEPLIGVAVYIPELKTGSVTDDKGSYRIDNLPKTTLTVQVTYVGHQSVIEPVDLRNSVTQNFSLVESSAKIDEVVVTATAGSTQLVRTPTPIVIVPHTDLLREASTNLMDALASQPGISQITTGGGISKPVIRGLGYNRVVVVNDGIRQEGQQWGDEHGIEIDEQAVNKAEILKGPASLMFGSDAMAGVINLFSAPTLPEGKIAGNFYANYQTNNGLMAYSLDLAGNKKGFIWDLRYSDKMAHDYTNKYDGYVYNSRFREQALTGLIGFNKEWGYSHLTFSTYQLTPGIVEGARDSISGKFIKPVVVNGVEGSELVNDADGKSYSHGMPYQQVKHYKAVWNNSIFIGDGSLKTTLGFQQNRRQEFGDVLNPDQYGLYFLLNTVNYDVHYMLSQKNGWSASFGVNGMYQHSMNKGTEFLVPEYNLFDAGIFGIASKTIGRFDISGGIRFDNRHEHGDDLYLNSNDEKTTVSDPTAYHRFTAFTNNFGGITGSLGAAWRITDDFHAKFNLSRGFRAPNIGELASNGVHDGTVRYEIGNSSLKPETSLQADFQLGYSSRYLSAEVDLFVNRINNYIFSRKLNSMAGGDSITNSYQTYKFVSGDARIMGGEFMLDVHPFDCLHIENSFSYVNSIQLQQPDSTRYLPMTPAPKWKTDVRLDILRHGNVLRNGYINVGVESYFAQNHFYAAYGTETRTPGYSLLYAGIGGDIIHKGHTLFSLYLTGNNLTDVAYQSHLSRLKYEDVNNATGRTGVYNMGRNFSIKLLVPINL
ncbi:TonB-dependent receptor [Paludibacter sp.]|uniref:TonB-dependent receptor n=1 Tax=Paludibacter sp. TaxID=1898105 RepID=UPI0013540B9D|nr:TonB-dependent receptor [Paludibacter sp.]MTK54069.1 TonB-dependent receptor [Paludibacter sp.]